MAGSGKVRSAVRPGLEVDIVLKKDQRTGALTRGIVKDILTNSPTHPHGIKVRLCDGQVGRVQAIIGGTGAGDNG
ncbi:YwbE family protein [Cohnella caldifontis]|uniref:YwbE family protein n=1 Tax=Cohnella caldifontis TaxID=3027471 RepID=UPI0023EB9411|nr:YwbE family protein [Cohnella sp. YIM B05605]